ncbi:MAG: hypothetical protein ACFCUQ_21090 [Kiloniellales bacterium]
MSKDKRSKLMETAVALSAVAALAGTATLPVAVSHAADTGVQIAQCNPCNPCDPCSPCNPCNPCNPCSAN